MYIEKFGREVLIDSDHPLVAEQRKADAEKAAKADKAPRGSRSSRGTDASDADNKPSTTE